MSYRLRPALVYSSFAISMLAFSGCAKETKQSYASRPEVSARRDIQESFQVKENPKAGPSGDLKVDREQISIRKSALEKEFLLQGSMIQQQVAAMGQGLKSRIVAFRQRGKKLYLLEATQGHTVTNELPQNLVLAEFPILEENAEFITFDFNRGMADLFTYGDWHAQDFESPDYDPIGQYISIKARVSYIEKAEMTSQNQLVIRQVAQFGLPIFGREINLPMEVKYFISPYQPDPTYEPIKAPRNFDRLGFFEIAPQLGTDGNTTVYDSRFHPKKPIQYAISANTPTEYKQAVRDGILYWNKVLGKDALQVVEAPEGVTAPDVNHNIVQWVNWNQAGFAYADAQMDPRSGQVLHSQVYLTSAFAFGGVTEARVLLRKLRSLSEKNNKTGLIQLSLSGFSNARLCDLHLNRKYEQGLLELIHSGADDEKIQKLSQDYVRLVAAHEIGHTLGLRHNFAGNTAANYSLADREKLVQTYLNSGETPKGTVVTSSVMDYLRLEESALTGDLLARQDKVFDYDAKAISTLYLGKSYKAKEIPLFCTDSHVGSFMDCNVFDEGSSPIEGATWEFEEALKSLPMFFLEHYIVNKAPPSGEESVPVEEVRLPSQAAMAKYLLRARLNLYKSFTSEAQILKVHRSFPVSSGGNAEEVRQAELSYIENEIERLGGIDKVLPVISAKYAEETLQAFVRLLNDPAYSTGIGYGGQVYSFSDEEKETMKKVVGAYLKKLQGDLILADLQILSGKRKGTEKWKIADHKIGEKLATWMKARADEYILSSDDSSAIDAEIQVPAATESSTSTTTVSSSASTQKTAVKVKLPQFTYPFEVRLEAAGLLKGDRADALDWGLFEKNELKETFSKLMEKSLTVSMDKLKAVELPKPVVRWFIENKKISDAL